MRAKKSVDILHIYRVLYKHSPPASEIEAHEDPAWLLRKSRYDTISASALFQEAKDALADTGPDDEDCFQDIAGDAIAANPNCFLDDVAAPDDQMLDPYSDVDSSEDDFNE